MKIRRSIGEIIFDTFNICIMVLAGFVALYPFLHIIFASFSEPALLVKNTGLLWGPAGFSLAGYQAVIQNKEIIIGYGNTLFYVIVGTTISVIITAMLAYVLANRKLKLRVFLSKMITITMFFSGGMIPLYMVVKNLGLLDTRWSVILPSVLNTYNLLIMRTAYVNISPSYSEAASIDGAGNFTVFWKVILPLCKPTLAVMVLYYGVAYWNSWFSAMIYIKDRELFPLQLFLREILIESSASDMALNSSSKGEMAFLEEVVKYATTVVATLPILCIYPFVQKYFVKGVTLGGVKE